MGKLKFFGALQLLLAWLAGSALAQDTRPLAETNPAEPDALIIAVDGATVWGSSCGRPDILSCPKDNFDSLEERGGVEELAQEIRGWGKTVMTRYYSDYWFGHESSASGKWEMGLEDLLHDLDWIKAHWGQRRARLMLLSGSQGAIMTHLAAKANPGLFIDYLVDLDDRCDGWSSLYQSLRDEEKNGRDTSYLRQKLGPWLNAHLCLPKKVPGARHFPPYHFTDIIPPNVQVDLEVHTSVFFPPAGQDWQWREAVTTDFVPNIREDGSRDRIYSFIDDTVGHGVMTWPGSAHMKWILDMVAALETPQDLP